MNKDTVQVLRTMTFTQLMEELRERGMSISQNKLKKMIELGLLPFAHAIPLEREEFLIWRKGFEIWANEHSVEEVVI